MQHTAPTLTSALKGPFSGVALSFIEANLVNDGQPYRVNTEDFIARLLNGHGNLKVDVFSLESDKIQRAKYVNLSNENTLNK